MHQLNTHSSLVLKLVLLLTILFANKWAATQPIFEPIGAKAWGLGGSCAAESNVFSIHNNIASLTALQKTEVGIYNQLRFGVKNLNMLSSGIAFPSKWLHVGVLANYYGYDKFNQQKITAGFAKKLNTHFSLGITLNYIAVNIAERENTFALSTDLGSFYTVNKALQIGFFLSNITQTKYANTAFGSLPSAAKFGFKYALNNKIYLVADAEKAFRHISPFHFRSNMNHFVQ